MYSVDPETFLSKAVKGKALVVDDTKVNQMLLKKLLSDTGYEVIIASNGAEAVDRYREESPDIIFMDVIMPVMDGYEATRQIKAINSNKFVPIIFITSLSEEESLVKCVASGGDDIIFKPFNSSVLKAKALAFERIRSLYNEVRQLHSQLQTEEELAERIFSDAVLSGNLTDPSLKVQMQPASTFSGDVILSAFRPNGELHLLMGDFTGHGLSAAIGALPLSGIFRSMTSKGYNAEEILQQINAKLYKLLPTGMFMAASMLCVSGIQNTITVWNAGMPDVIIANTALHSIRKKVKSSMLPLGILESTELDMTTVELELNDRILMFSDGVLEAINEQGQLFEDSRLESAIYQGLDNDDIFIQVRQALAVFCGSAQQMDDISIVEIPDHMMAVEQADNLTEQRRALTKQPASWSWSITLESSSLRSTDPIPMAISMLQEIGFPEDEMKLLFTVLTELYINAIDHGVLGLDSRLKSSAEGFTQYFEERSKRLNKLNDGFVSLSLNYYHQHPQHVIYINMEDSGYGFDHVAFLAQPHECTGFSGRGISLVNSLCSELHYLDNGAKVRAIFKCES